MQMWRPERAKQLIEEQGRTRVWVAKFCGVEPTTFNHYLTGNRNPSLPVLKLMAQALETTVQDLAPAKASTSIRTRRRESVSAS